MMIRFSSWFMPVLLQTWPGRWVNSFVGADGREFHIIFCSNLSMKDSSTNGFLEQIFYSSGAWPYNNQWAILVCRLPRACWWHASCYKSEKKLRTVRRPRTSSTVEISPRTLSGSHLFCMFPLFVYWHWFAHFEHFNYMPWNFAKEQSLQWFHSMIVVSLMCKSFNEQHGLLV